jgi:glycosyltransferase involved in cell wall biosynthesis
MSDWVLTHDFFYHFGGAERVTEALAHDVLPSAEIRTIDYSLPALRRAELSPDRVRRLSPLAAGISTPTTYRVAAPAIAGLVSMAKVPGHVLASSYAFAHYVQNDGAKVVYCHSPLRQLWLSRIGAAVPRRLLAWARGRDVSKAQQATAYISSGPVVSQRLREFYGIEPVAEVPPPIETTLFTPSSEQEDYLVFSGRIVEPYKRLAPVIEAFRQLPYSLVVAGDGRDCARLAAQAPPNVKFLGALTTEQLAGVLARSRGMVFPSADDFGMSPLEAMSCGVPVLAYAGGGALHTVKPELNGMFFESHDPRSLGNAIRHFCRSDWDKVAIRESALAYSRSRFATHIQQLLQTIA